MAGQVLIVLVSILAQRGGVIWVRLINALLPNLVFCEGSLDVVILGLLLYFTRKNRRWLSVGYLFYCGLQLFSSLTGALEVGNWSWLWLRAYQWMMAGSLPLMLCYNGERGRGGGKFFYLFLILKQCLSILNAFLITLLHQAFTILHVHQMILVLVV